MAKRSDPHYQPGELDQVRNKLGPLGDEEAKKMADLFGGEMGNEAADAAIEESYQQLRRRSQPGHASALRRPAQERRIRARQRLHRSQAQLWLAASAAA